MSRIDEDLHVHSTWSDGRGSLLDNIQAAEAAHLTRLGCVDHVRRGTGWFNDFARHVDHLRAQTHLSLLVGAEAKILDEWGHLDVPEDMAAADRIYIADHQLPIGGTLLTPARARAAMRDGSLTPERVILAVVRSTLRAMSRHPSSVIAHFGSILPKCGLSADLIDEDDLRLLALTARHTGTWLEIDERWSCPGLRTAQVFDSYGVPVVYSTDSHRPETIGIYQHALAVHEALHPPAASCA